MNILPILLSVAVYIILFNIYFHLRKKKLFNLTQRAYYLKAELDSTYFGCNFVKVFSFIGYSRKDFLKICEIYGKKFKGDLKTELYCALIPNEINFTKKEKIIFKLFIQDGKII